MEQTIRRWLTGFGADEVHHHGRPLTEHLVGTWRLLRTWGNPAPVAIAGGFHSVYGTEEFRTRTLPLSARATVASLIGEEAEGLVYLFCLADRRSLFKLRDEGPFHLQLPATGEQVEVKYGVYAAMLEIEVANIVEQAQHQTGVPRRVVEFWLHAFDSKRGCLSSGAAVAYRDILTSYGK
ncbi:DUF6817 domain-containing protein [Cupriavidus basilensis]